MTYDSSPRLNLFMIRLAATNTHTRRRWNHEWCRRVLTTCWSRCNFATFNMSQNTSNLLAFLFSFRKRISFFSGENDDSKNRQHWAVRQNRETKRENLHFVWCDQWRRQSLSKRRRQVKRQRRTWKYFIFNEIETSFTIHIRARVVRAW